MVNVPRSWVLCQRNVYNACLTHNAGFFIMLFVRKRKKKKKREDELRFLFIQYV